MSLCHVRLIKKASSEQTIEYAVESTDFETEGEWAEIGHLTLMLSQNDYAFESGEILRGRKFLPPNIYQLDDATRKSVIDSQYKDYGWGAWAMAINHYATHFLNERNFPDQHPPLFFQA